MAIIYQKNRGYSLVFGDINTGDGWEVSNNLNVSFDVNKSSATMRLGSQSILLNSDANLNT